jgi:hypothetical protein
LEDFKLRHKDEKAILESLENVENNPIQAEINIEAKSPEEKEELINWIKSRSEYSFIEQILEQ